MDALHPYRYDPSESQHYPIEKAIKKILDWGHVEEVFAKVKKLFGSIPIIPIEQHDDMESEWNYTKSVIYVNTLELSKFSTKTRVEELAKRIIFETMNALHTEHFKKLKANKLAFKISATEYVYRFEWQEFQTVKMQSIWIQKVKISKDMEKPEKYFVDSFPHHLLVQEVHGHTAEIDRNSDSFFPSLINPSERNILRDFLGIYYDATVLSDEEAQEELEEAVKQYGHLKNVRFILKSAAKIEAAWKKRFYWL